MNHRSTAFRALTVPLLVFVLVSPAAAIDYVKTEFGIQAAEVQYPCPLNPQTNQWPANEWWTYIVVHQRNVARGDRLTVEITPPINRTFRDSYTWDRSWENYCFMWIVLILGTDAEMWTGAWRGAVLLNDRKVGDLSWEVTPPRDEVFARYRASLASHPQANTPGRVGARPHYLVGASAALARQDTLAETEMREAIRLDPQWVFPHVALGRLYKRQGKRDAAIEELRTARTIMASPNLRPHFAEMHAAIIEDNLRQLGQAEAPAPSAPAPSPATPGPAPAPTPPPGPPSATVTVPSLGQVVARTGFAKSRPESRPNPDESISTLTLDDAIWAYIIIEHAPLPSDVEVTLRARWLLDGREIWQYRGSIKMQAGWARSWWRLSPPRDRIQRGSWTVEWFFNDILVGKGEFTIR